MVPAEHGVVADDAWPSPEAASAGTSAKPQSKGPKSQTALSSDSAASLVDDEALAELATLASMSISRCFS